MTQKTRHVAYNCQVLLRHVVVHPLPACDLRHDAVGFVLLWPVTGLFCCLVKTAVEHV